MDSALLRLFDEDDQARRDFACWEAERARRLQAEQADEPAPEPRRQATVALVQQARWDDWARGHVDVVRQEVIAWLDKNVTIFNDNTAAADKDIETINANFDRSKAEIDHLRAEVTALRSEVEELCAEIGSDNARNNVLPLLTLIRGRRDVA
jgi:hypothetical protein